MWLIVGLGNPGREHERQRHNAGFMVVDALRRAEGLPEPRRRFQGLLSIGEIAGQPIAVLEPQTYMNLSGESVQPAAAFLKIEPADILIVHDELDLPWGEVRLKVGGGHAGHNGLRSILQHLGSADFVRLRLGIGRPPATFLGPMADWVLSGFDPVEGAELAGVLERAVAAVRLVFKEGAPAAMNAVNVRKAP